MAKVPEDIGCNNDICFEKDNCNRTKIAKEGKARAVETFGGKAHKGCGKFIPIKK